MNDADDDDDEIRFGWDHGKIFIFGGSPSHQQVEEARRRFAEEDRREDEEYTARYRRERLADMKRILEDARSAGGIQFTGDWDIELGADGKPQFVTSARAVERVVLMAQSRFARFSFLRRQVWQEETGDALEAIAAMKRTGCSQLKIAFKVWRTIIWLLLNSVREILIQCVRK